MEEFIRPYVYLGEHIKSHGIPREKFKELIPASYRTSFWTQYYNGTTIFSVIDDADGRRYTYKNILRQEVTIIDDQQERVRLYTQDLPVKSWVNHGGHQHIRQKIQWTDDKITLEMLLEGFTPPILEVDLEVESNRIISFSYILKA